jgi:beta-galactosidase
MRQVLDRHGLTGPYPDVADLETAARIAPDGTRLLFLLNHRAEPVQVPACVTGTDLLTGASVECGQTITLDPYGVLVLRQ